MLGRVVFDDVVAHVGSRVIPTVAGAAMCHGACGGTACISMCFRLRDLE